MTLKALLLHAFPYRYQLMVVAALLLLVSTTTLSIPFLAGKLSGMLLLGDGVGVTWIVLLTIAVLATQFVLQFFSRYLSSRVSLALLADLRVRIHDHLQILPLLFHQRHKRGDLLALQSYEVNQLSNFLTGTLTGIIPALLTASGAVVLMYQIDQVLALLVPLLLPIYYIVMKLVGRHIRGIARRAQQAEADLLATGEENLEMLPAIKSFTREKVESVRFRDKADYAMRLNLTMDRINAAIDPAVKFVTGTAAILLLWFAGQKLSTGSLTPAELVSFMLYAALLTRPVGTLANTYGQFQYARGTLARLQSVMEEQSEPGYVLTKVIPRSRGEIRFCNVWFAYPDRGQTLRGASLTIRPGETIALVGANGSGKSTLVALLMRLFEPDAGTVYLDGHDISTLNLKNLRHQIAIVPQRPFLFDGSIRDNIGYGRASATKQEIEDAARLAQAHDFVVEFPQGYDTMIGDHGVRLSGGQSQRLALARALVKDPPILILDEATSMFDLEGEALFVEQSCRWLKNRTVILITHRPASLALADRILQVTCGKVREVASSEELLGADR
ncbi:ABC transporter ATP-binding protein [Hoeflea sp. CAU 1731]